jgi:endonuclease III
VQSRLARLLGRLRAKYGPASPPPPKNAFELVAWEKVAYLAPDEKRAAAFALLRRQIGLTPKKILAARRGALIDVLATGGIGAPERAENLAKAAELVVGDFDGDLDEVCRRPLPEAKKQLMRIRGIGEPGAEKILLFTRSHAVMGLDSNALRVLGRLGYGSAAKTYTATYRSATAAAVAELGTDLDTLIDANLLLRAHGQALCKTASPRCGACVIRSDCPSAERSDRRPSS